MTSDPLRPESIDREMRHEAVRRIAAAQIEDVPDPETLSKQLGEAYALKLPEDEPTTPIQADS